MSARAAWVFDEGPEKAGRTADEARRFIQKGGTAHEERL